MSSFASALAQVRQQQPQQPSRPPGSFADALAQVRQQPQSPDSPPAPQAPTPDPHPYLHGAENFGEGFLKGAGQLIGSIDNTRVGKFINSYGGLRSPQATQADTDAYQKLTTPHGTAQKLGALTENVGEGLLLPEFEGAVPLRIAAQAALGAGLSKAHGGSALAGALGGAGAEGVGSALHAVAPSWAEGAAGITARMRKFGRRPGEDILDYTTGFKPTTVLRSADRAIGRIHGERDAMIAAADQAGRGVDTTPALAEPMAISSKLALAKAPTESVDRVGNYLAQFPSNVAPSEAQRMQFGLKSQGWTNFNRLPGGPAELPLDVQAGMAARHALENGIELAAPGYQKLGNREGSLLAIKGAMGRRALADGLGQRVGERAAARTGALASSILGAQAAGPVGAIIAPILQETAALPATRLAVARAAYSPITKRLLRGALVGGATGISKP